MARGSADFDNLKLFFLKITGLKEKNPHMIQEESMGKGVKPKLLTKEDGTPDTVNDISGVFEGVYVRENEYNGDTIRELKITLKDDQAAERYIVACGMNSIGRDIMNRLLNVKKGDTIQISVYVNKNGYPAVSVKTPTADGWESVDWKYSIDDFKPLVVVNTVVKKGKEITERDFYKVEEKLINELSLRFPSKFNKPQEEEVADAPAPRDEVAKGKKKKSDAPF